MNSSNTRIGNLFRTNDINEFIVICATDEVPAKWYRCYCIHKKGQYSTIIDAKYFTNNMFITLISHADVDEE